MEICSCSTWFKVSLISDMTANLKGPTLSQPATLCREAAATTEHYVHSFIMDRPDQLAKIDPYGSYQLSTEEVLLQIMPVDIPTLSLDFLIEGLTIRVQDCFHADFSYKTTRSKICQQLLSCLWRQLLGSVKEKSTLPVDGRNIS